MADQTQPPTMTYAPPMRKVETALLSSWNDLHVRNEVDACLQSMLFSVEATYNLEQQLELENTKHQLSQTQAEHRATVLDAHAERLERYSRRVELADDLVVELVKMNSDMQQLLEWKEEHEYKVRNYDAVLAKLAQTEEELKAANRVSYGGEPKPRAETPLKSSSDNSAAIKSEAPTKENEGDDAMSSQATEQAATAQATAKESTSSADQSEDAPTAPVASAETPEKKVDIPTEGASAGEALKAAIAAEHEGLSAEGTAIAAPKVDDAATEVEVKKPPAVELIVDDTNEEEKEGPNEETVEKKEAPPGLLTMDVEPLMEIFGYLDPMDILNTAQINLQMYSKVDNIFGISDDGQAPPVPTPPPAAAPAAAPSSATAAAPSTVPTKPPADASNASKPAPSHKKSNSSGSGPLGMGLLSMLQPANPAAASSPPRKAAADTRPKSGSAGGSTSQPLNAKVAQSMAAKLSDAELAAIISMTDKLSKLEKEVHQLRSDKEVIAAKLEGTENVKQFLIGKVRDVEVKLNRTKEDEVKVTQQIASDQEVIAFLDSRVQELEQQTVDLTKENSITQAELDTLKVSSSKKITMLNDMLKYEREKVREDESDWKATKKVLVKEVKSCRAQILTLQAERDGLKGQNDMLNRAINSSSNGASKRSPGRVRRKNTE